jgi:hypothetical protein
MNDRYSFRLLAESDLPMLVEWFTRPYVAEVWDETPSLEEVREEDLSRMDDQSDVRPYIGYLDDEPLAYCTSSGPPSWRTTAGWRT